MKKKLLILSVFVLLTICSTRALAQRFNGGLIAGATFSQVDGDRYFGYHKLGFTGGAYANLPVLEHFALQMELKYTQMGAHSSDEEATMLGYGEYDLRLHYAEIPLLLQYDFGHFTVYGKSLDFLILEAGLSLDFLFKHYGEMDYSTQNWKLNFFSITGNYGLHFSITDHWGLGARMMYSITPIQTNPSPQWFFDHSYNKVIQFTLTYNINSPLR
jgi:hypothetical protein